MARQRRIKPHEVPAAPQPPAERNRRVKTMAKDAGTHIATGGTRANGARFVRTPPPTGRPVNRAHGPLPARLEVLLMQHGPIAVHFLTDLISGTIPGASLTQRMEAAGTIVNLCEKISTSQMSAFAILTQNLDWSRLTPEQLALMAEHQNNANAALNALLQSAYVEPAIVTAVGTTTP